MASRERILERLRAARRRGGELPPVAEDRLLYADHPRDGEDLFERFSARLRALGGEAELAPGEPAAAERLLEILKDVAEERPIALEPHPLLGALAARSEELRRRLEGALDAVVETRRLAGCAAGITAVEALVARTGSLLLRSETCGGRRISVLPPAHVAIARRAQLVASLEGAIAPLGRDAGGDWRSAVIITGPSRTADIEKVLVLGAHGPRRLVVLVVDSEENVVSG